jgi:hypothetical protein
VRVVGQILMRIAFCGLLVGLSPLIIAAWVRDRLDRIGESHRITKALARVRCPVCHQPYGQAAAESRREVAEAGPPLSMHEYRPSRGWIVVRERCGAAMAMSEFSLVREFRT